MLPERSPRRRRPRSTSSSSRSRSASSTCARMGELAARRRARAARATSSSSRRCARCRRAGGGRALGRPPLRRSTRTTSRRSAPPNARRCCSPARSSSAPSARAPARALLDAGAIVVLATDLNPGTSPVLSLPLVIGLAVRLYGLSTREALAATTLNAAWVLGLERRPRLDRGRQARRPRAARRAGRADRLPVRPQPGRRGHHRRRAGPRPPRRRAWRLALAMTATVAAMANAHSHAFQIGLRGVGERPAEPRATTSGAGGPRCTGSPSSHDPDSMRGRRRARLPARWRAPATASVGEFHYVHHQPDGSPYADPNAMAIALAEAAAAAGLEIALLPAAYHRAGWDGRDRPPAEGQRRFCDPDVEAFLDRVDVAARLGARSAAASPSASPSTASARCPPDWIEAIGEYAERHDLVRHVHACEQRRELDECAAEHGCTPIELLDRCGFLGAAHERRPRHPRVDPATSRCSRSSGCDGDQLPDHRGQPRRRLPARAALPRRRRAARDRQRLAGPDRPVRGGARARDRRAPRGSDAVRAARRRRATCGARSRRPAARASGSPGPAPTIEIDLEHPDLAGVDERDLGLALATCASAAVVARS